MESLEAWLTRPGGLAARLQALRVRAGLTGKQLADRAGWAQSKVSRIENGQQKPSAEDVDHWARLTAATSTEVQALRTLAAEARVLSTTFRARMRRGQAPVQEDYANLAAGSTLIRHFETCFIPGPLQLAEYTRRVLTEMRDLHDVPIDDIGAAIDQRQRRANMLYDPGKKWEFIIAEPVLYWLLPTPAVMRAQLDRLQTVIGLPNVRFGIIPLGAPLAVSPQNKFEIYVGEDTVAVVETFLGEDRPEDADDIARYGHDMDLLWEEAVEGDAARELIVRAAQALPEG